MLICTGETYKNVVKLTFAKGAPLKDPSRLFNSSLEGNIRRAIDLHEGDEIDEGAFKMLIRAAAALNKVKGPIVGASFYDGESVLCRSAQQRRDIMLELDPTANAATKVCRRRRRTR